MTKYCFSEGCIEEIVEEENEQEAWNTLYWTYRDISKFKLVVLG